VKNNKNTTFIISCAESGVKIRCHNEKKQ